jgi:hypothetical protein
MRLRAPHRIAADAALANIAITALIRSVPVATTRATQLQELAHPLLGLPRALTL